MLRVVDLDVYTGPVPPSLFAPLFMVSLVFGIGLLAYFFVYETTVKASRRSLIREIGLATVASFALSTGTLFLSLWFGVWL
ncbi:Dolichyl-diphosphooligosaccharide-protein glycosyltransferase subunit OST5 [Plasmodiophora brassicae]